MADKRTVLVTGCSDGSLGASLALAFQERGWRVFASARNLAKLKTTEAAGIESVQMDVGSEESIAAAVEHVKKLTGGSLDGLVNNAGAGYNAPTIHIDIEKAHELFELNVFSLIRVTRAFFPLLRESKRNPIIANNTSGSGILGCGIPFHGAYNASKAAAASLTENLRLELGPFGIRVINLVTGGVKSTFFDNATLPELPADSIYNIAKKEIEAPMAGDQPGMDKVDPKIWAKQVVADLSQSKPPYLVFRGTKAGTARIVSLLPIGSGDSIIKKMSGLDVLEKRLQEQGGSRKA